MPRSHVTFPLAILSTVLAAAVADVGAQPAPLVFHGTEVTPLGAATLTITPAPASVRHPFTVSTPHGCNLRLSNIGSSGDDGVRMEVGGTQGGFVSWQNDPIPVNGTLAVEAIGQVGTSCCTPGGKFTITQHAADASFEADFSFLGSSTVRVEIWDDGDPVVVIPGQPAAFGSATAAPASCEYDTERSITPLPDYPVPASIPELQGIVVLCSWPSDTDFFIGSAPQLVTGDEVRIFPENATQRFYFITDIDMKMAAPAGPHAFDVYDMTQQMFGHRHRGFDNATILGATTYPPPTSAAAVTTADHVEFKVTFGDGAHGRLQIDLEETDHDECIIWDIKDSCVCEDGDTDEFSVTGELLTGGEFETASVLSSHDGTNWTVTPDFSGSLSSDVRLELFDGSGQVLEVPNFSGAVTVATDDWASETGVEDYDHLALILGYPMPVQMMVPGFGTFTASRIKMHSNAQVRHRYFYIVDRTVLSTTGEEFAITAEKNSSATDNDGDGIPDQIESAQGSAYVRAEIEGWMLSNIGASGEDGVDIEPLQPVASHGVRWVPLGPPNDPGDALRIALRSTRIETEILALNLVATAVGTVEFKVEPSPTGPNTWEVIVREGGTIKAQYSHTDPNTAIAEASDWPIGTEVRLLPNPGETGSITIDFGYAVDVTIPGGPTSRNGAATPLTKADLIDFVHKDTSADPGNSTGLGICIGASGTEQMTFYNGDYEIIAGVYDPPRATRTVMMPPYPNPFNPTTNVPFVLSVAGEVTLKVYTVGGRFITTLHRGTLGTGPHTFEWDGRNGSGQPVASGIYLVRLEAPDGTLHTKVNLLK